MDTISASLQKDHLCVVNSQKNSSIEGCQGDSLSKNSTESERSHIENFIDINWTDVCKKEGANTFIVFHDLSNFNLCVSSEFCSSGSFGDGEKVTSDGTKQDGNQLHSFSHIKEDSYSLQNNLQTPENGSNPKSNTLQNLTANLQFIHDNYGCQNFNQGLTDSMIVHLFVTKCEKDMMEMYRHLNLSWILQKDAKKMKEKSTNVYGLLFHVSIEHIFVLNLSQVIMRQTYQ